MPLCVSPLASLPPPAQLPRNRNAYVTLLYFNPGDAVDVLTSVQFPILPSATPLVNLQLARLNATLGVVLYRNPTSNYALSASLVSVTGTTALTIWPATVVNPGTAQTFGLSVSMAALAVDRLVFVYNDGYNNGYIQDAGVFGTSVVVGR